MKKSLLSVGVAATLLNASGAIAQTTQPAQTVGLGPWTTEAVVTVGETINGYQPVGIPDGMGAFDRGDYVEVVSNHELRSQVGYPYTLASGAELRGARISSVIIDKETRQVTDMDLAYDTIYNRAGEVVMSSSDLDFGGLNRLCSAGYEPAGSAGFVDDVMLTGEETFGGTEFVLDPVNDELWAAPAMGRAAWESAAAIDAKTINETHVAVLVGDDRGDAALLLYVGEKQRGGNFLERNGLAQGRLYMWVADDGSLSPADWNGTGTSRSGKFVEVVNYNPDEAGSADSQNERGFDELGYATQAELDAQKVEIGAFNFSRPEDVHRSPKARGNGGEVVFASTGRNTTINQGKDLWGTTYVIDTKINRGRIKNGNITADITILYDGDDAGAGQFPDPDFGLRSPDNLVWGDDGIIYVQEDRSVSGFGDVSGEETSIWAIDPETGLLERVSQVDRSAIPDDGQFDIDPDDLGDWETSGIIDVTDLFGAEDERLLFLNVQAHSLRGGPVGDPFVPSGDPTSDDSNLVQGGQWLFMSQPE